MVGVVGDGFAGGALEAAASEVALNFGRAADASEGFFDWDVLGSDPDVGLPFEDEVVRCKFGTGG